MRETSRRTYAFAHFCRLDPGGQLRAGSQWMGSTEVRPQPSFAEGPARILIAVGSRTVAVGAHATLLQTLRGPDWTGSGDPGTSAYPPRFVGARSPAIDGLDARGEIYQMERQSAIDAAGHTRAALHSPGTICLSSRFLKNARSIDVRALYRTYRLVCRDWRDSIHWLEIS